jgi:Asp-tRNA(Asn)/Glu-tRNA(Gln) amidotransferase A subunit family amidase
MSELVYPPASALARQIAARTCSAVEVLEAHLAQIARVNPRLNALVALAGDQALAQARAADAIARGEPLGPLHGVPFSVKDWIDAARQR